jgi:hypothetical protein
LAGKVYNREEWKKLLRTARKSLHSVHASAADRQGQGDTRLTLTPSVMPNSNYVIMVRD